MVDTLSPPDARQNLTLFALPVSRNQNRNRSTNRLFGSVAEDALSTAIPACNGAVEIFSYNCVVTGFNDGCERTRLLVGELTFGQISRYGSVRRDGPR